MIGPSPEPGPSGHDQLNRDRRNDVPVRDPETGQEVVATVREFNFAESSRMEALAAPLFGSLSAVWDDVSGVSGVDTAAAMCANIEIWMKLLASATDRTEGWLGRLSDADGWNVCEAMWRVNRDFFRYRVAALAGEQRRSRQATVESSSIH